MLLLEYNPELIPAGGTEIVASSAAPVKHIGKDAAGHKFHEFALLQRGVKGGLQGDFQNVLYRSSRFNRHLVWKALPRASM